MEYSPIVFLVSSSNVPTTRVPSYRGTPILLPREEDRVGPVIVLSNTWGYAMVVRKGRDHEGRGHAFSLFRASVGVYYEVCARGPRGRLSPFSRFYVGRVVFVRGFVGIRRVSRARMGFRRLLQGFLSVGFLRRLVRLPRRLGRSREGYSKV